MPLVTEKNVPSPFQSPRSDEIQLQIAENGQKVTG